jgi:hypothetical protein
MTLMTNAEMIRLAYSTSFPAFVDFAFRELHTKPLLGNWHVDVMVDALLGMANGEQDRLVLNAPPRSLKSFCGSIALPAFLIGRNPTKHILIAAGNIGLRSELQVKLRKLMSSDRYRSVFPHVNFDKDGSDIVLRHGGAIRFTTIGHQISGRGADLIIVDDPLSPSHAKDEEKRTFVNQFYSADLATRLNDKGGAILVIMQRVHPEDLTNHILGRDKGFKELVLSAIALDDETWKLSDGRTFRRKKHLALDPQRESWDQLLETLRQIGSFQFSSQYLQGGPYFTEREGTSHFLWEVRKPPLDPFGGWGGMFYIRFVNCIVHKIFGVPYTGPEVSPYPPEWTPEMERIAIAYCAWLQKSPLPERPPELCSISTPMPEYLII